MIDQKLPREGVISLRLRREGLIGTSSGGASLIVISSLGNHHISSLQITGAIGQHHSDEYHNHGGKLFCSDDLYSFPSTDQIKAIFLDIFHRRRLEYEAAINVAASMYISCDHTFRIGKAVGEISYSNFSHKP